MQRGLSVELGRGTAQAYLPDGGEDDYLSLLGDDAEEEEEDDDLDHLDYDDDDDDDVHEEEEGEN